MSANRNTDIGVAIDMGTNTFHMLIAMNENGQLKEICRLRRWVNLAEKGIQRIGEESLQRSWNALSEFRDILKEYPGAKLKAVATEAFRTAENGIEFLIKVNDEFKIEAEIIPGTREAELIYKGIGLISPGGDRPGLIMDIGGGSTEFIVYDKTGMLWSHSFKAGVTYLYNNFIDSDPIKEQDLDKLYAYFKITFSSLLDICKKHNIEKLIGASGSFEVVELLAGYSPHPNKTNDISIDDFDQQYDFLINSTYEERLKNNVIPNDRARLIVVAYVLMDYIISSVNPSRLCVSPYAMKEGVISEILNI
jgi:exopolyphosphatase/guanosine-5'-triphosphate,3'-diphosphate pyrophosphatase